MLRTTTLPCALALAALPALHRPAHQVLADDLGVRSEAFERRDALQAGVVHGLAAAHLAAPSPATEAELRAALEHWFDLRQELRGIELDYRRLERAEFAAELEAERAARDELEYGWLIGALEEATPAWARELEVERAELWGEGFEALNDDLADWWYGVVETDPEGMADTLAAFHEVEPGTCAEARGHIDAELALLEGEIALVAHVLARDVPRGSEEERERCVEDALEGGGFPELRALVERCAALDLEVQAGELEHLGEEIVLEARRIEERAAQRDVVIQAEFLRRIEREHLLEW